jgi:hypothetical protein
MTVCHQVLEISEALDPSDIIWENLQVPRFHRFLRFLGLSFFTICILILVNSMFGVGKSSFSLDNVFIDHDVQCRGFSKLYGD